MERGDQYLGHRPQGQSSTQGPADRSVPRQTSSNNPFSVGVNRSPGGKNPRNSDGRYPSGLTAHLDTFGNSPTTPQADRGPAPQGSPLSATQRHRHSVAPRQNSSSPGSPVPVSQRRPPITPEQLSVVSQSSTLPASQVTLPKSPGDSTQLSQNLPLLPALQVPARPVCYDYQLKPTVHDTIGEPRYISPTTGKCRKLRVQSTNPIGVERPISGGVRTVYRLGVWLVHNIPGSGSEIPQWILMFLWFVVCIPWTMMTSSCGLRSFKDTYKSYHSRFWGQLWIARSDKEYTLHQAVLKANPMPLPPGHRGDTYTITHAPYPRKLMVYNGVTWSGCTDPNVLVGTDYIAVSYFWDDFPDKAAFLEMVKAACLEQGLRAYWLDFECVGGPEGEKTAQGQKTEETRMKEQAEKNEDLYRIADVYRGAIKTLIMIGHHHDPASMAGAHSNPNPWVRWGDRLWTLPEALLSHSLIFKAGTDPISPITLRRVGNLAYTSDQEEMAIINGFSGKDTLHRIERLAMLKNALWRRSSSAHPRQPPNTPPVDTPPANGSKFTAYPAERVYALMGFFEHRITPDPLEYPLTALARLSMANDSDRLIERMIAMLPSDIPDKSCWYSDNDQFNANIWDIEPEVQVTGMSKTGALVLDGCRAATIRWKNFPRVMTLLKPSRRRRISNALPFTSFSLFPLGIILLIVYPVLGGIVFAISLIVLIFAPKLLEYGSSGLVIVAEPWLVGIKGFMSARDASVRLYAGALREREIPMVSYTPSGSTFARPETGIFRRGDKSLSEGAVTNVAQGDVYTLVDTLSNTIYHFTAKRPPTVCVYVGREAGLGRFLLCSESCDRNELHKESVVRLPTYVADSMHKTDWLAIGGMSSKVQSCECD